MANNLNPKKILIFGTTSVGKTSLINLLTGENKGAIGSGNLSGTTFESHDYEYFDDVSKILYIFTDTIGLNEAQNGKVNPSDALMSLLSLIKKAKDGFNLVIYLRKAEVLTNTDQSNYNLIVNNLLDNQARVICVNSHGEEHSEDVNSWWEKNKNYFTKRGMNFIGGVSACLAQTSNNRLLASQFIEYSKISKVLIWNEINRCISVNPIAVRVGTKTLLIKVWNSFLDITGKNLPFIGKWLLSKKIVNEDFKKHLMVLGVKPHEAIMYAQALEEGTIGDND